MPKPMTAFEEQYPEQARKIERLEAEIKRLRRQLDEFVYIEDNPGYVSEAEQKQVRIEQLEAALRQIADYRSPPDKARNELEICQDQSSVRGRLARNALESAGDGAPVHCEWFEDDDGWHGSCGKEWEFIYDGPKENGLKFCMNCGKPVTVEDSESDNGEMQAAALSEIDR